MNKTNLTFILVFLLVSTVSSMGRHKEIKEGDTSSHSSSRSSSEQRQRVQDMGNLSPEKKELNIEDNEIFQILNSKDDKKIFSLYTQTKNFIRRFIEGGPFSAEQMIFAGSISRYFYLRGEDIDYTKLKDVMCHLEKFAGLIENTLGYLISSKQNSLMESHKLLQQNTNLLNRLENIEKEKNQEYLKLNDSDIRYHFNEEVMSKLESYIETLSMNPSFKDSRKLFNEYNKYVLTIEETSLFEKTKYFTKEVYNFYTKDLLNKFFVELPAYIQKLIESSNKDQETTKEKFEFALKLTFQEKENLKDLNSIEKFLLNDPRIDQNIKSMIKDYFQENKVLDIIQKGILMQDIPLIFNMSKKDLSKFIPSSIKPEPKPRNTTMPAPSLFSSFMAEHNKPKETDTHKKSRF